MGRSTNLVTNPAVRTFKWKNEKFDKKLKKVTQDVGWYYWDKGQGEDGEEVKLDCPARFIWLESMQSVTGFSKKLDAGIYSNEVPFSPDGIKEYGKQLMEVKVKTDTVASGAWKDISEEVKGMGGKYCVAVYGAMDINGKYEVVRFLFAGSSRDPWMKLADRKKLLDNAVVLTGDHTEEEMKTGETYQSPVLKYATPTTEELEAGNDLYPKVKEYFKFQFSVENEIAKTEPSDY